MSKSLIYKLLIPILLALAIVLGLFARSHESFNGNKPLSQIDSGASSLQDFYQETQQVSGPSGQSMRGPTNGQTTTTDFLAVGDIMLSRNVASVIQKNGSPDFPFSGMANILKSTDFNFANLESP